MTRFLQARTPRERVLLAAAAIGLPLLVLWQAVWLPLETRRTEARQEVARLDALLHVARQAPDGWTAGRPGAGSDTPLTRRVTQTAATAGLTLSRLDPEGARLRVRVEDAGFDAALGWIAAMRTRHGIAVDAVEMTRLAAPGRIALSITLEDRP